MSPKIASTTKKKLTRTYFDELKARIEYTMDLTQSGSHQGRPLREEAEDVVLHTYLVIAELMQIYDEQDKKERTEQLLKALDEQKKDKEPSKPTKPKEK